MMSFQAVTLAASALCRCFSAGQQPVLDFLRAGDVHGRGIGVVGRLAHVDVIVGMDRLLGAHHPAQHLDGAVGDHFIGVHVGLGARAGLPHHQREMIVQLAVDHFLGGGDDGLADRLVQPAQRHVGLGRGALDDAQRPDDGQGLLFPADLEIAQAALGLRAPIAAVVNFDGPESVGFGAGLGHGSLVFRKDYFLRNESRLTTSPGFSPAGAGLAATGSGVSACVFRRGWAPSPGAGEGFCASPSARN